VKFSFSTQLDLLARLGVHSPEARDLGWAFMAALLVWLGVLGWHMGRNARAPRGDALARAYLRLCRKLSRAGAARAAHHGPLAFAAQIAVADPQLLPQVQGLLERYTQLRYGPPGADHDQAVLEFRRAVARLSLRRAPA